MVGSPGDASRPGGECSERVDAAALTAAIFAFTLSFREYVCALTFISSTVNRTLPVGITVDMIRGDVYFWGPLMASAVLGSIPVVIVYALSLDHFISGMTTGAVK